MSLQAYFDQLKIEAGCDEAGRGCLAGPVVAASVILPKNFNHVLLTDSKMLSETQREKLVPMIKEAALAYAVGVVDHLEIDKINILNASFLAMHRAINGLQLVPELLLIDGNRFNAYPTIPHVCVVKGDSKYFSIAAASILAKTYRDELMATYHQEFPMYGWDKNKGYPTKFHRNAILEQGSCHLHRKTFKLLSDEQLVLFDAQTLR
jgi:ribonuclease HII